MQLRITELRLNLMGRNNMIKWSTAMQRYILTLENNKVEIHNTKLTAVLRLLWE